MIQATSFQVLNGPIKLKLSMLHIGDLCPDFFFSQEEKAFILPTHLIRDLVGTGIQI
jgi:hypothetical protein